MKLRSLVIALVVLSAVGIFAIYSSTRADAGASYALRQGLWVGLGFAVMSAMSLSKTRNLSAFAPIVYAATMALLVLVLAFGEGPHGTRRWFDLGLLSFQPSELAKVATVLLLARHLADRKAVSDSPKSILIVFGIVALPAFLILYEPNLGTAIVVGFIAFPMLYAAGMDPLYLLFIMSPFLAIVCAGEIVSWVIFIGFLVAVMVLRRFRTSLVVMVFGLNFLLGSLAPRLWMSLEPYQRQRILAFLNPESYRHGAGFQTIQSKIAVGSGGLLGKGVFKGTQKALGLVPEQHTDFVFSVIAEEVGFFACVAVLALLMFATLRMFRIAKLARNRFATYACFGFASLILFQTFINVGMNLGMMPVTGLTLPFLSYGGSSTVILWGTVGIALSTYASSRG